MQSKGLSRVFSNTTVQKHQFFGAQLSLCSSFLFGFPGGSDSKASACSAGNQGSIPGSGRSPGEGNGNPLQYSCPENPMSSRAWQPTVFPVVMYGCESWTIKKAEHQGINAFELWCWRRLLRVLGRQEDPISPS